MHCRVYKANLQPESGKNPDHVAVDETVIQLIDKKCWLYAVVDTGTYHGSELFNTRDYGILRSIAIDS